MSEAMIIGIDVSRDTLEIGRARRPGSRPRRRSRSATRSRCLKPSSISTGDRPASTQNVKGLLAMKVPGPVLTGAGSSTPVAFGVESVNSTTLAKRSRRRCGGGSRSWVSAASTLPWSTWRRTRRHHTRTPCSAQARHRCHGARPATGCWTGWRDAAHCEQWTRRLSTCMSTGTWPGVAWMDRFLRRRSLPGRLSWTLSSPESSPCCAARRALPRSLMQ
jgi:hypothetical protein